MAKNNQDSYELILQQTSKKKKSSFSIQKTYPAYIILLIFLIVSFFIRFIVSNSIEKNLNSDFEKTTISIMNRMENHYGKQVEVLESMSGLYDMLVEVVRDYFELYATVPTKNYQSILSVSYEPQVYKEDVDMFIITARSLGYYDYTLKSSGKNAVSFPVVNTIPENSNLHRLGFDLADDPMALDAIYRARNSNEPAATSIYSVRPPDTLGFFVFYPIYKRESERSTLEEREENFQAVLSLEIDLNKFIDEAISGGNKGQNIGAASDTTVIYELLSKDSEGKEYSVYKSEKYDLLDDYTPMLSHTAILKIADQDFQVRFYTMPNYGGTFQKYLPDLTLIVSIIISFAFFSFVLTQMTNKEKAQEIADKMTRSQRRIVDTSHDIIAILDANLTWKSMNPASLPIFGILPEKVLGKEFGFNLVDNQIIDKLRDIYNTANEDRLERLDLQMTKSDGTLLWIDWSFTISVDDGLIYCIGRDVTLEKKAEADARLRAKQIEAAEINSREANFSKSYFMKEMSHQLRNSLTGILGYLQLLQNKIYDSEEELDMYVGLAESSSEELFTYVTDIDEAAKLTEVDTSSFTLQNVDLLSVINKSCDEFKKSEEALEVKAQFNIESGGQKAMVIGDNAYVKSVVDDAISLLSVGANDISYDFNVEVNPYEGAVELQILSSGNKTVYELVNVYKENSEDIIDALKFDVGDVLLRMHKLSSTMRLLRGSFKVDTFGEKDGNLISIIFKSNKTAV